ncbi:YibE/F family protein [Isoptericola sp. AK164]|uniref:YibE/F family protein n=1 Tax=Isoptericola sp. AK164 TaxID=3024246 RepID=UPI002418A6FA|nr:YibE/F family protein [Isoptericola sp. AK164]
MTTDVGSRRGARHARTTELSTLPDGGHGHGHGGPVPPAPWRTRLVLALLVLPALVATGLGLWQLWPAEAGIPDRVPVVVEGSELVSATVVGPLEGEAAGDASWPTTDDSTIGNVEIRLADGSTSGMQAEPRFELEPGDPVIALYIGDFAETPVPYVFMDYEREVPLGILAVAYVLVVLLVARWRGLAALVGLAVAFAVFVGFTFPALLSGENAMGVALVTSSAVMLAVLYLAHGLTARTTVALLGTLAGLALTAGIGAWATGAAQITGASEEIAQNLPTIAPGVDLRGIALCGLVLAGMGVLNDVTITQASAVWELRALAPLAPRRMLFARAMRIGRDHIASTVYTIAFAYVGAALPLLLTVWLLDQTPMMTLTSGEIAEEIVRTLVGSIGLVLAIPITTAIAAVTVPTGAALAASAGVGHDGADPTPEDDVPTRPDERV